MHEWLIKRVPYTLTLIMTLITLITLINALTPQWHVLLFRVIRAIGSYYSYGPIDSYTPMARITLMAPLALIPQWPL